MFQKATRTTGADGGDGGLLFWAERCRAVTKANSANHFSFIGTSRAEVARIIGSDVPRVASGVLIPAYGANTAALNVEQLHQSFLGPG